MHGETFKFTMSSLSSRRSGFHHSSIPVEFVVYRVAVGQDFLPVLQSPYTGVIPPVLLVPFNSYSSDVI